MCLNEVTYRKEDEKFKIGYKFFRPSFDGYGIIDFFMHHHREIGTLYKEISRKRLTGDINYETGFHIFKTKRGALAYRNDIDALYKVEYRDVVAEGFDNGSKVVVAKQMRIIKKVI